MNFLKRKERRKDRIHRELGELELYRQQRALSIDVEINNTKQQLWESVDLRRLDSYKQITDINTQVARLEIKKEAFTKELELKKEIVSKEVELLQNENRFLRETIVQFARNQVIIKS